MKFEVLKVLVLGCHAANLVVNDVSRQSIGSTFKGFEFDDVTDKMSRNVGKQLPIHAEF